MAHTNHRIQVVGGRYDGYFWEVGVDGSAQWYDRTGLVIDHAVAAEIQVAYLLDSDGRAWRPKPVK